MFESQFWPSLEWPLSLFQLRTPSVSPTVKVTSGIASNTSYADPGSVLEDVTNHTMFFGEEGKEYTPYEYRPETYIVPVVLVVILLIGITGNGVLTLIILRHNFMKNISNVYVFSLALGDLMVMITCVPFTLIIYIMDSWPFGLFLCKVSEWAKDISSGASIFTLIALSVNRFLAVADPMRKFRATGAARCSRRFWVIVAVVMWILAILFAIPASFSYIRVFRVNSNVSISVCYPFPEKFGPNYPKKIVIARFCLYYAVPLSIIAIFYILMARHLIHSAKNIPGEMQSQMKHAKTREEVAKTMTAFVIIFAVCFLPQHVFMLWFHIHPTAQEDYNTFWHYFRILSFCLAFTHSCINPIALYCISSTYREYFNRYLFCCVPWIRRQFQRSSKHSSKGRGRNSSLMSFRRNRGRRVTRTELRKDRRAIEMQQLSSRLAAKTE